MAAQAHITRRAALSTLSAIPLMVTLPAPAAQPQEAPRDRVNRLAFELSKAMDDWMVDLGFEGVPDLWMARVWPAGQRKFPVLFEHIGHDQS